LIIVVWPVVRRLLDARVMTRHCHYWTPHRLRHDPHARHKTLQQCKLSTRRKFPVLLVCVCTVYMLWWQKIVAMKWISSDVVQDSAKNVLM